MKPFVKFDLHHTQRVKNILIRTYLLKISVLNNFFRIKISNAIEREVIFFQTGSKY